MKIKILKIIPLYCINILNADLKNEFVFLKEVDSLILYNAIFSLSNNIDRYNNSGLGFPKFKSKQKAKYFYKIDRYYPSSKTCSICNNIMDRDLNASINIMFEVLKHYMTMLV